MGTKEIEIEYEGKKEKVVIRRMGWAEKNTFSEGYVDIDVIGNTPTVRTHTFEARTGALLKCLVSAPFMSTDKPLNKDDLNELDTDMLENIYKEIENLNSLGKDQKKNSAESSGKPGTKEGSQTEIQK